MDNISPNRSDSIKEKPSLSLGFFNLISLAFSNQELIRYENITYFSTFNMTVVPSVIELTVGLTNDLISSILETTTGV